MVLIMSIDPTHYLLICRFHECHVQLAHGECLVYCCLPRIRLPYQFPTKVHSFTLPPSCPHPGQLDVVCGRGSDNHIDSDGAFAGGKKGLNLVGIAFSQYG